MKCAYCGDEGQGTKEHIISHSVLELFPECDLTYDDMRNTVYKAEPMIKDVCAECNNKRLSYIDSYAKSFIQKYFVRSYNEEVVVEIEYDYAMIQKMLLKYAFNDMRSRKQDCSFFDKDIRHFLLDASNNLPLENLTILCGLAVNVSPVPEEIFGNLRLRWCKDPIFFSNSTVRHIDYATGQVYLNENNEIQNFDGLRFSYAFRFNSAQFLLLCWEKESDKIDMNNIILQHQYPYHILQAHEHSAKLPLCTDEVNYHQFNHIHIQWDGLFEVGRMRRIASEGRTFVQEPG